MLHVISMAAASQPLGPMGPGPDTFLPGSGWGGTVVWGRGRSGVTCSPLPRGEGAGSRVLWPLLAAAARDGWRAQSCLGWGMLALRGSLAQGGDRAGNAGGGTVILSFLICKSIHGPYKFQNHRSIKGESRPLRLFPPLLLSSAPLPKPT